MLFVLYVVFPSRQEHLRGRTARGGLPLFSQVTELCTHPSFAKDSEPVAGAVAISLQQPRWSPALGAGGDI